MIIMMLSEKNLNENDNCDNNNNKSNNRKDNAINYNNDDTITNVSNDDDNVNIDNKNNNNGKMKIAITFHFILQILIQINLFSPPRNSRSSFGAVSYRQHG